LRTWGNKGTRRNKRRSANDGPIQNYAAYPNEATVMHRATVKGHAMANSHIIANNCWMYFTGYMNNRAILYIGSIAYPDIVDITTDDYVKP
jgi:hypothetical protein